MLAAPTASDNKFSSDIPSEGVYYQRINYEYETIRFRKLRGLGDLIIDKVNLF